MKKGKRTSILVNMKEEDKQSETNMFLRTGIRDFGELASQKTEVTLGLKEIH